MRRFPASLVIAALAITPVGVAHAQSARITGVVTDSVHRAPLAEATVIATPIAPVRDTVFHSARTDANGRFAIAGLQAGKYVVSVEHAFTDSIGLAVLPKEVQVTAESTPPQALALPSVTTLRRTLCRAAESDTTLGVMLGTVRQGDGGTVSGATVVFVWTDLSADRMNPVARAARMTASVTTDTLGVFRACGLPTGVGLLVQAQHGAHEQSGVVEERIGAAGVLVRELRLGDTTRVGTLASGADTSAVHGAGVVHGVVLSRAKPVTNAQVRLFGTSRVTTTNERGEFRLTDIPTGTQGFEITALGYMPRRFRADVTSNAPVVRVTMSRAAAVLDSARVTARRNYNGDPYREFDERSQRLLGQFITEEEIARRHPFLTSDMFRQIYGFAVVVSPITGKQTVIQNRGVTTIGQLPNNPREGVFIQPVSGDAVGRPCTPQLFVNGVPGGDPDEFPPSEIHGIEIYTQSETPARFNARCGAILIWTK